jgi:hypothetical protein
MGLRLENFQLWHEHKQDFTVHTKRTIHPAWTSQRDIPPKTNNIKLLHNDDDCLRYKLKLASLEHGIK